MKNLWDISEGQIIKLDMNIEEINNFLHWYVILLINFIQDVVDLIIFFFISFSSVIGGCQQYYLKMYNLNANK